MNENLSLAHICGSFNNDVLSVYTYHLVTHVIRKHEIWCRITWSTVWSQSNSSIKPLLVLLYQMLEYCLKILIYSEGVPWFSLRSTGWVPRQLTVVCIVLFFIHTYCVAPSTAFQSHSVFCQYNSYCIICSFARQCTVHFTISLILYRYFEST